MKFRFSTLDVMAILPELRAKICTGWRVNQVFDCDYKTYIFKLNKSIVQMKKDNDPVNVNEETENKMTFIIESGLRIHSTDYDWPRSPAPGQFATKLRKHLRNKRVEDISQVGIDRLVDIRFGSQNHANHLLVEFYDKGNLILTDHNYCIIAILRWRKPIGKTNSKDNKNFEEADETDGFKVGQTYPINQSKKEEDIENMTIDRLCELLNNSKVLLNSKQNYKKRQKSKGASNDGNLEINLKDLLNPYVLYGSSLLEDKLFKHLGNKSKHNKCLIQIPVDDSGCLDQAIVREYALIIRAALDDAEKVLSEVRNSLKSPGYIVQKIQTNTGASSNEKDDKKDKKSKKDGQNSTLTTNLDFFPIYCCAQRKQQQEPNLHIQEYESFDKAVDVYYTSLEAQKIDSKAFSAEKEARKKLENLKIAQEKKLNDLARAQKDDEEKARLIELNCDQVEDALLIMRSMIANQMSWSDIRATIKEAQSMNDPIASLITGVNFERNEFTMKLCDPYEVEDRKDSGSDGDQSTNKGLTRSVDIDIGLSAYANARKFFSKRRTAVDKERKTIEVSKKAFKNVERRTKEMLKDVVIKSGISKARKRYWFENFFWFISTDGFLVVAGRDAEQNDLLVKRYMKTNDIYVHADLHGASSVIIKNEFTTPVPPKTLNEAGVFAVCNSSAWDSRIAFASWWVYPKQVTKSAPSGEYLTSGAFVIRGKKNYLPVSNLVLGFGFVFRLGDESIDRRRETRLSKERNNLSGPNQNDNFSIDQASANESDGEIDEEDGVESGNSTDDDVNEINPQSRIISREQDLKTLDADDTPTNHEESDQELEGESKSSEHRLIDTITENPLSDDILLYAIPMCGPYSAFQSFKYKVKVIPGNNKRGKAAKTCLGLFLHDKGASQREKDLLKALKDQDYARNIPNKVKISAPNMKAITKKRPKKSEVRLPIR